MAESLLQRICRHVELSGPLPIAEYMHWCMADREQGYYGRKDTIGEAGDFLTAPETSQMFGEMIGVCMMEAWHALGSPSRFNLVELGPGKGTLMSDLLRAAKTRPEFLDAARIHLVETSKTLIGAQRETLKNHNNIHWHADFADIPTGPALLVANEFLDVLPVRQYVKHKGRWHERCVAHDEQQGKLSWVLGDGVLEKNALPDGHEKETDGAVYEIAPAREAVFRQVAERIARQGGAALFIDYGHTEPGFGDTLQAMQNHAYAGPLEAPGMADITSHVDFSALENCIRDLDIHRHPVMPQGDFLLALGLLERAGALGAGKPEAEQAKITRQTERLALPSQMGDLFKVIAISSCKHLVPFTTS